VSRVVRRRAPQRLRTALGFAIPALLVAAGLCGALWLVLRGSLYHMWLIATGIVALFMFRLDKWQASRHGERVPEVVLHMLTLLGGFWGSALGMSAFPRRHKTRDRAFWAVLLLSIAVHVIIFPWLLRLR
jgi:uncharacterized membrane protein YsdA (DUF1294 family)